MEATHLLLRVKLDREADRARHRRLLRAPGRIGCWSMSKVFI